MVLEEASSGGRLPVGVGEGLRIHLWESLSILKSAHARPVLAKPKIYFDFSRFTERKSLNTVSMALIERRVAVETKRMDPAPWDKTRGSRVSLDKAGACAAMSSS